MRPRSPTTAAAVRLLTLLAVAGIGLAHAQTFVDVSDEAGLTHVQTTIAQMQGLDGSAFLTGGVAAGDFDGDGLTDLVFTRLGDVDLFYRNQGDGTFEARSAAAGFTTPTLTNGVVSGDIDNDGDLDLYMTATNAARHYLYLNDGAGVFSDAGATRTVALDNGVMRDGQGASFGDYNNDGYLDLVTADWQNTLADSQSRLFENLGASQPGFFTDVTVAAGLDVYRKDQTWRFSPRLVDLDRDGHLDMAIASDFRTSQLFWNNGDGTFVDGTIAAGVGTDHNGMGSTFGDYDGDGDLDWFITNITAHPDFPTAFGGWNRLYRNDGNRQFTDVTEEAGVRDSRWSWGTSFFDYDNDGDLDLIATNGYAGVGFWDDRTTLWRNDEGVFTDVSDAAGIVDTGQGRGLAHLDFDNDGDLDIVIVNQRAEPILYRNDGGNGQKFLRLDLTGTASNRDGVGAFLTVTPDLDDPRRRQVWEIDGGSSFLSQNEQIAHFGLGASTGSVDLVAIQWPSGVVQHLYDLAANLTHEVLETNDQAEPGDLDFDQQYSASDVDWLRTAGNDPLLYQAVFGVAPLSAGDLSGDGIVDEQDVGHLLNVILGVGYGDLNVDGVGDAVDVALWAGGLGELAEASYAAGDVDGDQAALGLDYLAVQRIVNRFGASRRAAIATPEPATVSLLAIGVCCRRRRRPPARR